MKKSHLFSFLSGVVLTLLFTTLMKLASDSETKPTEKMADESQSAKECPPPPEPIIKECAKEIVKECPKDPTTETLEAPTYHESMPPVLETGIDGEVKIRWNPVDNAKTYLIRLYSTEGKQIGKWKTNHALVTLKNLPFKKELEFTPYRITVSSVNRLEKIGPESDKKDLKVKKLRNIIAPKIDSITVED